MRIIVAALAALALVKIYGEDQIYRSATSEALIAAYRARAVFACQTAPERTLQTQGLAAGWMNPRKISVEIGRDDLGVDLWDTSHALWDAAFTRAYLVLTPAETQPGITCRYDIETGNARVAGL